MIRLTGVRMGPREERLVLEVLRSGHLVQGPMVERLETRFAELVGVRHAVAMSSGTTALVASLEALEVGPGDEVVTSPFTFAATVNAILEVGARVRFADILEEDLTMDPAALPAALTPRTKAIMPVHLYGYPADMPAIEASANGVAILEDAAQAHLARIGGRAVGTWGIGVFSLYATKNLTTGEGGIVTTDGDGLADRLRLLRNQGMRDRYRYEIPGHNYRLSDLHAAVGLPQLETLAERTERRQKNAARLNEGLADLEGIRLPQAIASREHVYHQFTIRVTPGGPLDRDGLADELRARGVETGVYYPRAVYDYDCYREHPLVDVTPMPIAERAAREVLSLPVHPWLSDADLDTIVRAVREALGV